MKKAKAGTKTTNGGIDQFPKPETRRSGQEMGKGKRIRRQGSGAENCGPHDSVKAKVRTEAEVDLREAKWRKTEAC